jgi:HopA1 effector protein family
MKLPQDVTRDLGRLLRLLERNAPSDAGSRAQSDAQATAGPANTRVDPVVAWLYATWYCALPVPDQPAADERHTVDLRSALRIAPAAAGRWETGWVVLQSGQNGVCSAGCKSQMRVLSPGDYANIARPGMPVAPGDALAVRQLVDWVDEATGFWCAQSSHGAPRQPLNRLYLSASSEQVGFVLHAITAALDSLELRYTLKCPCEVGSYARADSVVVYLEREAWTAAKAVIQETARDLKDRLRDARPPLTRKIGPGAGMAEDPHDGTSFGESRCRALAPGVRKLLSRPARSTADSLLVLAEALRAAAIDPRQPWRDGA